MSLITIRNGFESNSSSTSTLTLVDTKYVQDNLIIWKEYKETDNLLTLKYDPDIEENISPFINEKASFLYTAIILNHNDEQLIKLSVYLQELNINYKFGTVPNDITNDMLNEDEMSFNLTGFLRDTLKDKDSLNYFFEYVELIIVETEQ